MTDFSRRAALAVVVGLIVTLGSSRADADLVFNFEFDDGGLNGSSSASPPFVGSGTVTFANDPGNGTFLLDSLGGFSVSFTLGSDQFSTSNIVTPLGQIEVVLSSAATGRMLQFSNVNAFGTGPDGGSIDFINASGAALTFEPPGFGALNEYQEFAPLDQPQFAGHYLAAAVPEPRAITLILIGGLPALAAGSLRRQSGPTSVRQVQRESSP